MHLPELFAGLLVMAVYVTGLNALLWRRLYTARRDEIRARMTGPSSSATALTEPAEATPLISVRSLSKSFSGPGGRPLPVLDDINLDVAEGEFVALLGRSGSGKSTLLRCIAGLMAPTEGEVRFRGQPLTGTNRETSMVFQTFALMPWLTVQQNVELGLEARGVTRRRAGRAGAARHRHRRPGRLRVAPTRRSCPAACGSASGSPGPWWSSPPRC